MKTFTPQKGFTCTLNSRCGGFSLVETLIAITILLLAIVGPMTIASKGLQNAVAAQHQLTAMHLAQEGIEHVFRLREESALLTYDDNTLNDTWDFYTSLPLVCTDGTGCQYDVEDDALEACSNGCKLYEHDAAPYYTYTSTGGTVSPFTRRIYVTGAGDELDVRVIVEWEPNNTSGTKSIELSTRILNQWNSFNP